MSRHLFFFFNDTATTEIYTLSLHDALPIFPLPVAHQALQRFGQPQRVERQWRETRNQPVHGVVEPGRLLRDEARGLTHGGLAALRCDGRRETAYGGHRLAEFIMQLVRDQAPLLLDPLLDEQRELAALLEAGAGLARLALRLHLVLHRLRHAVEGRPDRVRLRSRQARSEEHTSELQPRRARVCRLLLEK